MDTSRFDYDLPDGAIAQTAVEPRDSARLLVAATLEDRVFRDLPELLDPGDVVVVNSTRVRAARLTGARRDTGGVVEVLLLGNDGVAWEALVRPARRLRAGIVVEFDGMSAELMADPVDGVATVRFDVPVAKVEDRLPAVGTVPLPPYFHGELSDPGRYQTMFAKSVGSAAAPTAGLHFTRGVVAALGARGIEIVEIDLEVGLDTFRPISAPTLAEHRIHTERYTIPDATARAVAAGRSRGARIVAIGTTVVRAVEAAAARDGTIRSGSGTTDLFITPGFGFRVVDRLVTNFHVPASTLVVLVEAFMGAGWRATYETALARGYRFLSFGDAMVADRA